MKKKFILTSLSICTIIMLISSMLFSSYASLESDKKQIEEKKKQTEKQLNNIKEDKKEVKTELDKVNSQVEDVQNKIDSLKLEIKTLNSTIENKEKEIKEEEEEIKRKDELLKARMVALYEAGETSFLDVLFNSENLFEFLSSYSIIQQIVETDTELITELENKKAKLEEDKNNLEKDKKIVENKKTEQEISKANLKALQEKKQHEVNKLSESEKEKQKELEDYKKKEREIENAIAEALRKAQEEEAKNNSSTGGNGSHFNGSFAWPLDYSPRRVTSRMKFRWGRWHKGIDIGTNGENGKRVVASASGTVIYSTYQSGTSSKPGYGNYLIIYHGDGFCSLYAHMQSKVVSEGQRVSQGQLIGYSGSTGGVAPHLHFEIRKATSVGSFFGNNWLDPLDYLPGGYTLAPGA